MDSGIERSDTKLAAPSRVLRHVMLSKTRNVITELELADASVGDGYLIRQRDAAGGVGQIMDSPSWIGFRYHAAHWSFVKQ